MEGEEKERRVGTKNKARRERDRIKVSRRKKKDTAGEETQKEGCEGKGKQQETKREI